jgi:oxygen-independent coproporphyrinogen-3 oxidase
MSGLYIHIPFCKQACNYCNFHFSTSLQHVDAIIEAMTKEIAEKAADIRSANIETIYLGGGSPSILSAQQLQHLYKAFAPFIDWEKVQEFTLEANPDDITETKLKHWIRLGINRLSIGVQSFRNEDLVLMNRAHDSHQAIESIRLAQNMGIQNISIDLIYGIPGLSQADWLANLNQAIALDIPHVSSYCLTVEPKTVLAYQIKRSVIAAPNDEEANLHFQTLISQLALHGIEQYEISNFAKRGFESKHNSAYWKGKNYIGIGPGAHAYDGNNRYWNISNNQLYKKAIENKEAYFETEALSLTDRYNEYIMTSIRTREGIEKNTLLHYSNKLNTIASEKALKKWLRQGKILENKTHYFLSTEARFFADGIASDLFLELNSI